MVDGYPPFYDENPMKVYQLICSGKYNKDKPHFSAHLIDIIEQLLQKNPSKRIGNAKGGVADICKHKWFGAFDWKALLRGTLPPVFTPKFDARNPANPKVEEEAEHQMVTTCSSICHKPCNPIFVQEESTWVADLGEV